MDAAAYAHKYIKQGLTSKLISWLSYLFFPTIIVVLSNCQLMVRRHMAITICFLDSCLASRWSISILNMFCNPEVNGRFIWYDNDDTPPCWRECLWLSYNGQGIHIFVGLGYVCPIIQKHFPFKDTTQDFACSLFTRYTQQASTRLLRTSLTLNFSISFHPILLRSERQCLIDIFDSLLP